jgi:hypothetical protein
MADSQMPQPQPNVSPLEEVNALSLDEFLSRDPFDFTKQDRLKVIRLLREQRAKWETLESQGKRQSKSAAKTPKEPPKVVSLDDLLSEDT